MINLNVSLFFIVEKGANFTRYQSKTVLLPVTKIRGRGGRQYEALLANVEDAPEGTSQWPEGEIWATFMKKNNKHEKLPVLYGHEIVEV